MNKTGRKKTCEVVTIGSELLLGQILDTNGVFLAETLNSVGIEIIRQTTVGDTLNHIVDALDLALKRADLVITTGGLGPTEDDLTREAVARVLGVEQEFHQDLLDQIAYLFKQAGYSMPENNRRQAYIPAGSQTIINPVGTAPCFLGERNGSLIISLPGVPKELKYLMAKTVIPLLKERFGLMDDLIHYRVLHVTGLGESSVDNQIGDLITSNQNPEIGLLASAGSVRIRIAARAKSMAQAEKMIAPLEQEIRSRLGQLIFGEGNDTLEGVVENMLVQEGFSLAVLETFTGGELAAAFSRIRSTSLKESFMFGNPEKLEAWLGSGIGRLEKPTHLAEQAAKNLIARPDIDVGLAVVGFIEEEEEMLDVEAAFAVAGPWGTNADSRHFGWHRDTLRERGAIIGGNILRKALLTWAEGKKERE